MSGIFGVLGQINTSSITEITRRLFHRGAESEIQEVASDVRLGCVFNYSTRMAQNQHYTAVSDSNIYNKIDLGSTYGASETQQHNDTSVLLSTYLQAGIDGLSQINGQFSFAIWDDIRKELVLARDYNGTLPLYYFQPTSRGLVFASEYKALLALESLPAEADLDMIQRLQHYKHLPSDKTLLKGVKAIPPGTIIVFNKKGKIVSMSRLPTHCLNIQSVSIKQSSDSVAKVFLEATRARVSSLKVYGVALSGGIDSIGVACACKQANPDAELHTFTAGYGPEDPEVRIATFVADKIGSIHHNIFVTPQDMAENIPLLVWHMENPISRTESLQFFKLGQEAKKFVEILFTGVAADGLFAGNPKHKLLWLMHLLPMLRSPLEEFYQLTQSGQKPNSLPGKFLDQLYYRGNVPQVLGISGSQFKPESLNFPSNSKEFVNEVLCKNYQEGLSQWLPKVERTLRASGMNYTSPFLDRRVLDVAFTIPSSYKIRFGKEKYVLRQALRSLVPAEVLNIPKFPMIMKHDVLFSNAIDAIADQVLSEDLVGKRGYFDFTELQNIRQRKPGKPYSSERAMRIWTAMLTEVWAQEFLDFRGEKPIKLNT